ncbi:MAG: DsrE family protein [Thermoplasmata archaeon]
MDAGIILGSNEYSSLMFAAIEAGMRTSMGDNVIMFVTMDGALAFLRNPIIKKTTDTSKKMEEDGQDFVKYLREAKESGLLKIYICYFAAELHKLHKKDMSELVDDIWGITKFSIETESSQIISIW